MSWDSLTDHEKERLRNLQVAPAAAAKEIENPEEVDDVPLAPAGSLPNARWCGGISLAAVCVSNISRLNSSAIVD